MAWYPGKMIKRFVGRGYGARRSTSEEVPIPGDYYIWENVIAISVKGDTAILIFETGPEKTYSPVKLITSCPPYRIGITGECIISNIKIEFKPAENEYNISFETPISIKVVHKYDGYYIYLQA